MVSRSECGLVVVTILFVSTIIILTLVFVFTNILTKEFTSSATSDKKDCIEYTYNKSKGDWECIKKLKKSSKWMWLIPLLIWMAIFFILFLNYIPPDICKSQEEQARRRQIWMLERPVVWINTVNRDYTVRDIMTTRPIAPSHMTAFPPMQGSVPTSEQDSPPPEYLPPPAYSECVINMDTNNHQSTSNLSRII